MSSVKYPVSGGYYTPLVTEPRGEGEWQLDSAVLGLELHTEGHSLRLYDPAAGHYLLTPPEQAQARRAAEQRAAEAEARAAELEAEIARLKAALEGQTGERSD
ncbi:MAG: hypothetical protein L0332_29130 [Chloroflexi bacterium]|nr:hypothetical protein [Chloroflexota bacterium]MCI0576853.1 hypothetical protein [Chloroflexota bacterium]MCI0649436.1 hypothetical protein [Chloroflexota bacterium]MCI0730764.1 hypothetical protein [Chloroflexota bacterium]